MSSPLRGRTSKGTPLNTHCFSHIGLSRKSIFLMRSASNAPVDQVNHFQDNHQQPEIEGEIVTKKKLAMERIKTIGTRRARNAKNMISNRSIVLSMSRCPLDAYNQITSSIKPVAACSEA